MNTTYLNDLRLKPGMALVLRGPQGAGKNIIARDIARHYGSFTEMETGDLEDRLALGSILDGEPRTLIITGTLPRSRVGIEQLKSMISSERIVAHVPMSPKREVRSPNIIFCTSEPDPFALFEHERRFWIVDVRG